MISFYRVQRDFVRVPAHQIVYLTQGQRQRQSREELEEPACGYVEPGWHGVYIHEELEMCSGELLGLRAEGGSKLLSGLELQWVKEREVLRNRSVPTNVVGLHWEILRELRSQHFTEVTGLRFSDFHEAISGLIRARWEKQGRGGRKEKWCVEDCLYITLLYRQGKGSYQRLAKAYEMSASRCYDMVKWVEKKLCLGELSAGGVTG
jgi:hypothetical protein